MASFSLLWLKLKLKFFDVPKPSRPLFFLVTLLIFTYSISTIVDVVFTDLPSPTDLVNRKLEVSTKIYDRNGVLLYQIYKDENRTPIKLDDIPLSMRLATLAVEDSDFYHHPGFSVKGILRSIIKNVKNGEITGGSTITQQLVKNALLSPEKTLSRKLREIVLSVRVESYFSKDQIFEMYLNEVSYGNSAYGVEEAAKVYFGKNASELDLSESALLAGLPKSPTRFSPFGSNPERAFERQKEVLNLMVQNNYISQDAANVASKEKIAFAPRGVEIKAPHFVMFVKELLVQRYGEEMVEKGGLEVYTTLDYSIQQMAEKVVASEISKLGRQHVTNGASVVMDPKTGEILAMVGSKNYFDLTNDGNVNVTLRPRSPGSSIKLVTYSYALSNGMTPATVIPDSPISISLPGQLPYVPKNYDSKFRGNITLRSALAESRNIPAVRVITSFGVNKIVEMGRKMGITTWEDSTRFGPALTLGGGEVKLVDLARVYATVANNGKRPDLSEFIKITNHKGEMLLENQCSSEFPSTCQGEVVLDSRVAYLLTDILKDNLARSPAFGSNSYLVIPNHPEVAVKTGTSNDLRDNLTIGYNQNYLVAVWVGNNDNSPMNRIASGVTGAAPIWNQIMKNLIGNTPSIAWNQPDGISQQNTCGKMEWFLSENKPISNCAIVKSPDVSR